MGDAVRGDVCYFNNYVRDENKDGPLEPRYVPKMSGGRRDDRDSRDSRRDDRRSRGDDRRGGGDYNSRQDSRRSDGYGGGRYGQNNGGGVMSRHSKDQLRAAANGRQQIDYNDLDAP